MLLDIKIKEDLTIAIVKMIRQNHIQDIIEIIANVLIRIGVARLDDSLDCLNNFENSFELFDFILEYYQDHPENLESSMVKQGFLMLEWVRRNKELYGN